jgi:hypothetical protein
MITVCRHRITFSWVDVPIAQMSDFDESIHAASSTSQRESGAKVISAKPTERIFASVGISTLPRAISSSMYSTAAAHDRV